MTDIPPDNDEMDPAEAVTVEERAEPPQPAAAIQPETPSTPEPARSSGSASSTAHAPGELPVGPPTAAIACLLLWIFLQFVVQGGCLLLYAVLIGAIDLTASPAVMQQQMVEFAQGTQRFLDSLPADHLATMLVVMTVLVWALTLVPVWFLVGFVNGTSLRPRELLRSRRISMALGFRPARAFKPLLWLSPLVGVLTLGVASAVQAAIPGEETPEVFDRMMETPVAMLGLFFMAVLLAPVLEELFFRGFLYVSLRDGFQVFLRSVWNIEERGPAIVSAAVTNSMIFSGIHIMTYGGFKLEFLVPLFVMSLVMAWLREQTGSTWPCVLAHAAFNATSLGIAAIEAHWGTM